MLDDVPADQRIPSLEISALRQAVDGEVLIPSAERFKQYTTLFNSNVRTDAALVVRPLSADDVSKVVKFCNRLSLTLSVKAGGFGTHGWAIGGDVVLDLSLLNSVDLSLPYAPTAPLPYTSLAERVFKRVAVDSSSNKRSRKEAFGRLVNGNGGGSGSSHLGGSTSSASGRSGSGTGDGSGSSSDIGAGKRSTQRVRDDTGWGRKMSRESSPSRGDSSNEDEARAASDDSPPPGTIASTMTAASGSSEQQSSTDAVPTTQSFLPAMTWTNPNFDASFSTFTPTYSIPPPPSGYTSSQPYASSSALSGRSFLSPNVIIPPGPPTPSSSVSLSSSVTGSSFGGGGGDLAATFATSSSSSSGIGASFSHSPVFPPLTMTQAVQSGWSPRQTPSPYTYATFGAGCLAKEIDTVTSRSSFGPYYVPFAAFPVGTAVMISGGFGFLSREHGLSMDNLVEVEVVLADGEVKIVNEKSDPELWWGIRGFGPSLCICTRYIALAYPVSSVYSGNIIFPFNRATAPSLLKHFRDCVKAAPRKLYANVILTAGPSSGRDDEHGLEAMADGKGKGKGGGSVVIVQICYNGPSHEGQDWVRAICAWGGEQCVFKDVEERSFLEQQDSIANVLRGGMGRKWFIKGELLNSLTDEIIHETIRMFRDIPDGCSWLFELSGGAIEDTRSTCFPATHREAKFNLLALHQWPVDESAEEDLRCISTAEDWINRVIAPGSPGGPIPCFLNQNIPAEYVAKSFGPTNWARLQRLKRQLDPNNLFRFSLGGGSDALEDAAEDGIVNEQEVGASASEQLSTGGATA